jgi:lipopolysaccharide export system protein LptA
VLLAGLGGVGWGAWYLATHPTLGAPATQPPPPALAVRAESLTVSGWQRHGGTAERLWQVTAHDVRSSTDGRSQWFRQITDGILFRDGASVARFSAGQGQGDQVQNTFTIHSGAHVRLEGDGTEIATDVVQWRGPQRQLWLPQPIHLTRGDMRLDGARSHLDLQAGRLTSEYVSGSNRDFHFQARHGALFLKGRRLELSPVALSVPEGQGHARRVVYYAEEGRLQAQEIQMKLTITPAALRSAAATGLTLALAHAAVAASQTPERKTRQITIIGDTLADTPKETVFKNAVVYDQDSKVTADQMVVEKDAQRNAERIIATGKPRAVNDRNVITGEKMTVYPKERRVVVEGKVHGIVQPKPDEPPPEESAPARDQVKDGTIDCDRLEYDYRNKNIAAQGNLKLVSRGRTVIADRATYIDKTEQAEFFGPVHYRDDKGYTFETPSGLKLYLKKGAEELHAPGKFKGVFPIEDQDDAASTTTSADGKEQNAPAAPSPSAPASNPPSDKPAPDQKKTQ